MPNVSENTFKQIALYMLRSCIIAASYFCAGKLGIMLAIPPGQATAIWPASGIALAALIVLGIKYWPAVLIGATILSYSHGDGWSQTQAMMSMAVGCGATMQASIAALILRRKLIFPTAFEQVSGVLQLFLWGGFVCCLINASIGTAVIYLTGSITQSDILSHFYVWWIGDVLGVIVFTPAIILFFHRDERGGNASPARRWGVFGTTFLSFLVVAVLFSFAKRHQENEAWHAFLDTARDSSTAFVAELDLYKNTLIAVERYFSSSGNVSAREYDVFTDKFFELSPGLSGLSWLPKVLHQDRYAFEESLKAQGFENFEIKSRFGQGDLKRSKDRDLYYPLAYTEPYELNSKAHGFDVYGPDPLGKNVRIEPLDNARDTGKPKATGRFPIVQNENQYGFIIYHPVYMGLSKNPSKEERREKMVGYINGIFLLPALMEKLAETSNKEGIDVLAYDLTAQEDKSLLFDSRSEDKKLDPSLSYEFDSKFYYERNIHLAGRDWQIRMVKASGNLAENYNWQLWLVITGGALFTSLLSLFMMIVTARADVVERLVDMKTTELKLANDELEEFAYRTSHDLRSPLISSSSLLEMAQKDITDKNEERAQKSIEFARESIKKLIVLIEDLLVLTEAKNVEEELQSVNFEELVDEALENLKGFKGIEDVDIQKDINIGGNILVKRMRLRLVVENFISNAIKYQDPDKKKRFIKVSAKEEMRNLVIEVHDNGLGVPKELQGQLFLMFKRFHPGVSFGTGLGLYMVKKSANILGGNVKFIDPGDGSLFRLTIPLKKG